MKTGHISAAAKELIRGLLRVNAAQRLTVDQALAHKRVHLADPELSIISHGCSACLCSVCMMMILSAGQIYGRAGCQPVRTQETLRQPQVQEQDDGCSQGGGGGGGHVDSQSCGWEEGIQLAPPYPSLCMELLVCIVAASYRSAEYSCVSLGSISCVYIRCCWRGGGGSLQIPLQITIKTEEMFTPFQE